MTCTIPQNGSPYPRAIAAVPASLRDRPVLNSYSFGGPLILAGIRPDIDGRADMYGDTFVLAHQRLVSGDGSEAAFAGTLLGAVALGVALSVAGWWWVAPRFAGVPPVDDDQRALAEVRAVVTAQGNFRAGVDPQCGALYADLSAAE